MTCCSFTMPPSAWSTRLSTRGLALRPSKRWPAAGLLVDPNHDDEITVAMWRVLSDPILRAEMRSKGLQRADAFSWQRAAEQTMEVYRKVAGA